MASITPGPRVTRPSAEPDVYAVLLLISALFLLVALIYVGYRAATQLGGLLPPPGL